MKKKKNMARSNHRSRQNNEQLDSYGSGTRHSKQENKTKTKIQFRLKRQIKLATINIRGSREGIAAIEVEEWMTTNKIEMA